MLVKNIEIAKLLIKPGADINITDKHSRKFYEVFENNSALSIQLKEIAETCIIEKSSSLTTVIEIPILLVSTGEIDDQVLIDII